MIAYDITDFLRSAYLPFAYCVPSKAPEYCVPNGGVTLTNGVSIVGKQSPKFSSVSSQHFNGCISLIQLLTYFAICFSAMFFSFFLAINCHCDFIFGNLLNSK